MAKNTGIERSKKNPIELGKRGASCIFGLSVYSPVPSLPVLNIVMPLFCSVLVVTMLLSL
jgi:hypothetical protein